MTRIIKKGTSVRVCTTNGGVIGPLALRENHCPTYDLDLFLDDGFGREIRIPAFRVKSVEIVSNFIDRAITATCPCPNCEGGGWHRAWLAEQNARQPERDRLFRLIAPAGNWKDPINTLVADGPGVYPDALNDAVIHFTGGPATVTREGNGYRVVAKGYYFHVGA